MFLLGLSANILPYLLVILVPLMYYIEEGTGNAMELLQQNTFKECIKTSISLTELVIDNQEKEPPEKDLPGNYPIKADHKRCPIKIPLSLQFINIPRRAPPVCFY